MYLSSSASPMPTRLWGPSWSSAATVAPVRPVRAQPGLAANPRAPGGAWTSAVSSSQPKISPTAAGCFEARLLGRRSITAAISLGAPNAHKPAPVAVALP
jgi:hypothetical protein